MGGCCCVDSNTRSIESKMKLMEVNQSRIRKILMLGSGASGKTTLFKQLEWLYGIDHNNPYNDNNNKFNNEDVISRLKTIRENIRDHIILLMKKSVELYDMDHIKYQECNVDLNKYKNIVKSIQFLSKYQGIEFTSNYDPKWKQLGIEIKTIWELKAIQETYKYRNLYSFSDNMDYFFNKCDKIFNKNYSVSEQDFLKSRIRTTGVNQIQLEYENNRFNIVDVGGQRNERAKWIHQFSIVTAVIFVSALNHFNTVLFEDETVNAMHESINLFREIVNLKHFTQTDMIMFLNKNDLFIDELMKGASLSVCFNNDKWNGPNWDKNNDYNPNKYQNNDDIKEAKVYFENCYEKALEFIRQRYQDQCLKKPKLIHFHTTTATDRDIVKKVFWDIQHIILRGTLENAGMIEFQ